MAIINCEECGYLVHKDCEKCPSCGKKINKGGCVPMILVWFSLIIIFLFYLINSFEGESDGGIINDDKTYYESWRSPQGDEYLKIGRVIVGNNVKVCGEYKVKEIMKNEFLIACTPDGENWSYFIVYPNLDEILAANDEMIRKLTPPR